MKDCPNCEYHKARAKRWREEAYKHAGHPLPEREWAGLTDEDRQAAFESMPNMLDGFLKTWGWLHFSKAIEAKLKEKNT